MGGKREAEQGSRNPRGAQAWPVTGPPSTVPLHLGEATSVPVSSFTREDPDLPGRPTAWTSRRCARVLESTRSRVDERMSVLVKSTGEGGEVEARSPLLLADSSGRRPVA